MAAVEALSALKKPCRVDLYSDSQYLVNAFNKYWIDNWMKQDFRLSDGGFRKNHDIWKKLYDLTLIHEVSFHWVKGHSDNPYNCRCDKLAVEQTQNVNSIMRKMSNGKSRYNIAGDVT